MTTALEGDKGSGSRPGRSLPPGKTRYPLYRRLSGPQVRSGQVRKISSPPGFDPRVVQSVAQSLYRLSYPTKWSTISFSQMTPLFEVGQCTPSSLNQSVWVYVWFAERLYKLVEACLTLRLLMSYIYGAPILDVSRSHTTTQHSR